jgi:Spy/CpxP family protein refolding chaperone
MAARILALIFAAFLLTAAGAEAKAQQPSPDDASKNSRLLDALFAPITDRLNLTQEQQAQIESVGVAESARGEALLLRLNRLTAELDEEQSKETFDEDRVRDLAAQAGHVMAEMTVIKLRVKARVFALLTPVQRALVEEQLRLSRERDEALSLY